MSVGKIFKINYDVASAVRDPLASTVDSRLWNSAYESIRMDVSLTIDRLGIYGGS